MTSTRSHPNAVAAHRPHSSSRRESVLAARFFHRLLCAVSLLTALVTLSTCGGGSTRPKAQGTTIGAAATVDPEGEANAVVVTVGGHAITRAMFGHVFSSFVVSEGPGAVSPVPPDFVACINHLEAASTSSMEGGSTPNAATLKSACKSQYEKVKKHALDLLIAQQWVIGAAAEEGVSVSGEEVALAIQKAEEGQSTQHAEQELAKTGRTLGDFALETRVMLLGERLRNLIKRRTEHLSQADIGKYYNEHRGEFGVPKRRDLEIVRAGSKAEALKFKAEIAAGRSFASIAKGVQESLRPTYSKDGFVREYRPRLYREPPLDRAIFAAKPHVLSGPVGISLGYYVFRVTRTYPPQEESPAQAEPAIRKVLPTALYREAFAAFVARWRHRWRAKTDCQPGFIVQKCRQFSPSSSKPLEFEDPSTLN
jgi:parvulin-like peptidyl-prolyl isomerase